VFYWCMAELLQGSTPCGTTRDGGRSAGRPVGRSIGAISGSRCVASGGHVDCDAARRAVQFVKSYPMSHYVTFGLWRVPTDRHATILTTYM